MTGNTIRTAWAVACACGLCLSAAVYAAPQVNADRRVERGKNTNTDKKLCGGFAGLPCDEGEFCYTLPGQCCCDHIGFCVPQVNACPAVYAPICGCDGNTYGNVCEAIVAGVNVDYFGECIRRCPGPGPAWLCQPDEFCKAPIGVCGFPGPIGVCTDIPQGCPDHVDPVCGCNGVTYSNSCEADAAGVNIAHLGSCDDVCRPTNDGSACQNFGCGTPIPEVQCVGTALHIDWTTGAIRIVDCDCMDFNLCHVVFGNASPFAVGYCPTNTGSCQVIGQDTDNDGLDDTFRAACQNANP